MTVSILIPSTDRAEKLGRTLASVAETVGGISVEIVCSLSYTDPESLALVAGLPVVVTAKHAGLTGAVRAWNEAAAACRGDVLAMIGDDVICLPGWLERALTSLESLGDGVVGMNDLNRKDGRRFATHIVTTRHYCQQHNGGVLLCPAYTHYYPDVEICERAGKLGKYVFNPDAQVDHQHHLFGKHDGDHVYQWALTHYERDQRMYERRRAAGFPNDYEAIL